MIPELTRFAILAFTAICALLPLAESERLEDWRERRHVNRLADRSRGRKATTARSQCRYARAYMRPAK